ncbi:MAG: transglutaminase family protein [Halomonadaceae bacterium]|nr:MAG: transglutaminase family protein [Halomonadaceae bacterium]
MEQYLEASEFIDWRDPLVLARARRLSRGLTDELVIAAACYRYVRDSVRHSGDHGLDPVTCRASEVVREGAGLCYGKSHLLAALLRANELPAGLCYQRVATGVPGEYGLHGLNAVWLHNHGWYRMDARGNRPGLKADFCPPVERLPYTTDDDGEYLLPGIYARPLGVVTTSLLSATNSHQIVQSLPDMPCDQVPA